MSGDGENDNADTATEHDGARTAVPRVIATAAAAAARSWGSFGRWGRRVAAAHIALVADIALVTVVAVSSSLPLFVFVSRSMRYNQSIASAAPISLHLTESEIENALTLMWFTWEGLRHR